MPVLHGGIMRSTFYDAAHLVSKGHERVVLVGSAANGQGTIGLDAQPCPAAAKTPSRCDRWIMV